MIDYKKNKYELKLQEYLMSFNDRKSDLIDMKYCAKLRRKAEELTCKKNYELYKLINSSKKANINRVKYLIDTGADVNARFEDNLTFYMLAALNAQLEVLDVLKEEGADVEAKTNYGQDALMLANLIKHDSFGENKRTYLHVVRKLQSHGLGLKMEVDYVGLTRDDYYLGNTDPFTTTYLNLIKKYLSGIDKEEYLTK